MGGPVGQGQQIDQEEFMEFLQDMVGMGHIKQEELNEGMMPQLIGLYGKMKKEGKWKSKKKGIGFMKGGGKLTSFMPSGRLHRFEHKQGDIIKAKFGIDVSKKGIPVLSSRCDDNGCGYKQEAEIEAKEVIIEKSVVDRITAKKDKPVEAGKLIYKALLNSKGDLVNHKI